MPSPAIFGTRPQRPREVVYNRDPNRDTLRASVLDVALELGIGSSRAVENLIFDSVLEEDEVSIVLPRLFPCFSLGYLYIPRYSRTSVLHLERKLSEVVTSMTFLSTKRRPKCACPSGPGTLHCPRAYQVWCICARASAPPPPTCSSRASHRSYRLECTMNFFLLIPGRRGDYFRCLINISCRALRHLL